MYVHLHCTFYNVLKQRLFCFKYKNKFVFVFKTITIRLIYFCSMRAKYIKAGPYF